MTTLITGGTGFIGSRLALALAEGGVNVRVYGQANTALESRNAATLESHGIEWIRGSVTDPGATTEALQGTGVVFHLAAAQHEANAGPEHFRGVNVDGTRTVLDAAVRAGVRRFVHGSTIGVYGGRPGATVTENAPLNPTNLYGRTKLEGEKVVESYADRLAIVIVRISETYGPGDGRLLKLFRAVRKGRFLMIGRGLNLHHLVYVDDLVEGLCRASTENTAIGRTFVLAGPTAVTTREMVAAVAKAVGAAPPRWSVPLAPFWALGLVMEKMLPPIGISPPLHRRRLNFFTLSFKFSMDVAREAIAFDPVVNAEEGMQRTARYYQDQGAL